MKGWDSPVWSSLSVLSGSAGSQTVAAWGRWCLSCPSCCASSLWSSPLFVWLAEMTDHRTHFGVIHSFAQPPFCFDWLKWPSIAHILVSSTCHTFWCHSKASIIIHLEEYEKVQGRGIKWNQLGKIEQNKAHSITWHQHGKWHLPPVPLVRLTLQQLLSGVSRLQQATTVARKRYFDRLLQTFHSRVHHHFAEFYGRFVPNSDQIQQTTHLYNLTWPPVYLQLQSRCQIVALFIIIMKTW